MELEVLNLFCNLNSKDGIIRKAAFDTLMEMTDSKVAWVQDVFYGLSDKLRSKNAYQRSIGAMMLANLAKSDQEEMLFSIADRLFALFNDEKLMTSRQTIGCIWKLPAANSAFTQITVEKLLDAFSSCRHIEQRGNLIRQDIVTSLMNIYKAEPQSVDLRKIKSLVVSHCDVKEAKKLILQIDKEQTGA